MASGDFYTRNNEGLTDVLPNGGTPLDANWDNLKYDSNSIATYTNPNVRLQVGIYYISYSEKFYTADTTNNERIEVQGEIHTVASGVQGGYSQDYIRKSDGQQECSLGSSMILEVTSANTDVFIRFYRTDNSTTGTVNRVAGNGAIHVLQLDNAHNYGLYSIGAIESTSGTTVRTLNLSVNNRQDTGFTRNTSIITIANSGQYLATYSMDINQGGTAREEVVGFLEKNSSIAITGSYSYSYLRGSDSCQDGALTWSGIIDVTAGDTIRVRWNCPSSATINATSGSLQLWEIPNTSDATIIEATNGDMNSNSVFAWDTELVGSTTFSYTNGNTDVLVSPQLDGKDVVMVFSNVHNFVDDPVARAYPVHRVAVDGVTTGTSVAGSYLRNNASIGKISVNTIDLFPIKNQNISIKTKPEGVSGAVINDSGQFSLLSLTSVFGSTSYAFPPVISFSSKTVDDPTVIGKAIGIDFGANQGTGVIEYGDNPVYSLATLVSQPVLSWSDTNITFTPTFTGFTKPIGLYVFVTNGVPKISTGTPIIYGVYTYTALVDTIIPDHYWKLDNDYLDSNNNSVVYVRDMANAVVGTQFFGTPSISEDTTVSVLFDDILDRREISDSNNMNIGSTLNQRTLGGWIQLGSLQKTLGAIFKEGGQVQNLAFLLGVGNVLMAQLADAVGRDNVQSVSDFRLSLNRPYHIIMRYDVTEEVPEFKLVVDGEIQLVSDGNPMTYLDFTTHGGDVVWGDPDNNLETGGTDIAYRGIENCRYSNWYNWSDNSDYKGALDYELDIKDKLFRRGAIPKYTIASDTQANMQIALDALGTLEVEDWPLGIRIEAPTGNGNLELTATNLTFNPRTTVHLEWQGGATLTWISGIGSSIDENKTFSTISGIIDFKYEVPINIKVINIDDQSNIVGARIYIVADAGGDLAVNTLIATGNTDGNGDFLSSLIYSNDQPIKGVIRKGSSTNYYKSYNIVGTITNIGFQLISSMIKDE